MAYAADRERGGEQNMLVGLTPEPAEGHRDVDVGRMQDAAGVERAEQASGAQREPGVVRLEGRGVETVVERSGGHRSGLPVSSRSESPVTSAAGGRQSNTPHTDPSRVGVSGPHMPRRNR